MENFTTDHRYTDIVEKSKKLFGKYGFKSISMDDIARELGVSKKTLYQYVKNKADLIQKTFELDLFRLKSWVSEIIVLELNAIEEFLVMCKYIEKDFDHFDPAVIYDLQKYYPSLYKSHMEEKQQFVYTHIRNNILKGMREGLYRDDLDADLIAGLYIKKMIALHSNDLEFLKNLTFEKIFEVMIENHIRAISNPAGIVFFEQHKQNYQQQEPTA